MIRTGTIKYRSLLHTNIIAQNSRFDRKFLASKIIQKDWYLTTRNSKSHSNKIGNLKEDSIYTIKLPNGKVFSGYQIYVVARKIKKHLVLGKLTHG